MDYLLLYTYVSWTQQYFWIPKCYLNIKILVGHQTIMLGPSQTYSTHTKRLVHSSLLIPMKYNTRLNLQVNNTTPNMHTHPKILGLNLSPKLTHNKFIDNMPKQSKLYPHSVFSSTKWSKHKEILSSTYKAITRPVLEYASHYMYV